MLFRSGAVATRCDLVIETVTEEGLTEVNRGMLAPDKESWTLIDTMVANYVPPISQLIRREVADRIGHWDGNLLTQADWDFNLRLLATSPVGFIDGEPLAHWHHRDSTDESVGNSVVVDAVNHRTDNLAIRDRYTRLSLDNADVKASPSQGGPAEPENLGFLLVSAEYYHRLEERLRQQDEKIEQQGHQLRESMAQLNDALSSLRFTIGDLHGSIRHVLLQIHETKAKIDHLEASTKPLFRTVAQGVKRIRRG